MNEDVFSEDIESVENKTKVLIGLSKSDGLKVAVTAEEYDDIDKSSYVTDGVIIRNDDVDLLFSPDEVDAVIGASLDREGRAQLAQGIDGVLCRGVYCVRAYRQSCVASALGADGDCEHVPQKYCSLPRSGDVCHIFARFTNL